MTLILIKNGIQKIITQIIHKAWITEPIWVSHGEVIIVGGSNDFKGRVKTSCVYTFAQVVFFGLSYFFTFFFFHQVQRYPTAITNCTFYHKSYNDDKKLLTLSHLHLLYVSTHLIIYATRISTISYVASSIMPYNVPFLPSNHVPIHNQPC